jgi:hypothetical protein
MVGPGLEDGKLNLAPSSARQSCLNYNKANRARWAVVVVLVVFIAYTAANLSAKH